MPGSRRGHGTSPGAHTDERNTAMPPRRARPTPPPVRVPRHIILPPIPQIGLINSELFMFVFLLMVTYLQFLHLYRSVWWLPQSYTKYIMNYYLVDLYLVGFIVTIFARKFVYLILWRILAKLTPRSLWPTIHKFLVIGLLIAIFGILIFFAYHIIKKQALVNLFYLCYPFFIYWTIFGLRVEPFFDISSIPGLKKKSGGAGAHPIGNPTHTCSQCPRMIRQEVENMRTNFNARMKHVLFNSIISAYYAGFVPCCFADASLHFDTYWTTQHMGLVWLACFAMQGAFYYPPSYCDTLHRAALHLGRWVKVSGKSPNIPTHVWDDKILWSHGALVRHAKDYYKAEGITTAAVPGNSMHNRFYMVFCDPTIWVCFLLGAQTSLIIIQLLCLVRSYEWYYLVSSSIHITINYYMMFRIARDFFISVRVYSDEQDIFAREFG